MSPRRFGLGPVFAFEWLTASRRWQMYAVRSLAVGILFAAVFIAWSKTVSVGEYLASHREHARVGEALFFGFFSTLLSVILFAAPAATAGAICIDKARGTLLHLMVTDLSNFEIAFGKLAARLAPVFGLIAASIPVLALCTLLGGIDPDQMLRAYAVTLGAAFFGCALALLLSVWGRKTHEVLLAAYLIEIGLVLIFPVSAMIERTFKTSITSGGLIWTNPYMLALTPQVPPADVSVYLVLTIGGGLVCALLAAFSVRRAAIHFGAVPQRKRRARKPRRRLWPFGPKLDPNPVLWREWHRQRPTRWTRAVWLIYGAASVVATLVLAIAQWNGHAEPGLVAFTTGLQVSVGLLLASVSAVTALAEERVRGSLDVLLTTPLATSAIVWGKWRGAFRRIPLLAILPIINILLSIFEHGRVFSVVMMLTIVLVYGAWVTSMGLALATWIPRLGRAIAASAAVYVLVTAGWLALVATLSNHTEFEKLGVASPFYGPGQLAFETVRGQRDAVKCYAYLADWCGVYAIATVLLYAAMLRSFNYCLGRVSESGNARRLPICFQK